MRSSFTRCRNITIGIDGSLTVAAGDEIASQVEDTLYKDVEFLRRAHVHYHPVRILQANSDGHPVPKYVTFESQLEHRTAR